MKKLLNILFILLITITLLPSHIVEAVSNETEIFYGYKIGTYSISNATTNIQSDYYDGFYRNVYKYSFNKDGVKQEQKWGGTVVCYSAGECKMSFGDKTGSTLFYA